MTGGRSGGAERLGKVHEVQQICQIFWPHNSSVAALSCCCTTHTHTLSHLTHTPSLSLSLSHTHTHTHTHHRLHLISPELETAAWLVVASAACSLQSLASSLHSHASSKAQQPENRWLALYVCEPTSAAEALGAAPPFKLEQASLLEALSSCEQVLLCMDRAGALFASAAFIQVVSVCWYSLNGNFREARADSACPPLVHVSQLWLLWLLTTPASPPALPAGVPSGHEPRAALPAPSAR